MQDHVNVAILIMVTVQRKKLAGRDNRKMHGREKPPKPGNEKLHLITYRRFSFNHSIHYFNYSIFFIFQLISHMVLLL